tara:strand:+ start:1714 stop:1902 length:189 start_codon:yes stop_codon:yes gene_type:complete
MSKELERLKVSLQINIDDTNHCIELGAENPTWTDADWHWHVGYRTALKEVLEAITVSEIREE